MKRNVIGDVKSCKWELLIILPTVACWFFLGGGLGGGCVCLFVGFFAL